MSESLASKHCRSPRQTLASPSSASKSASRGMMWSMSNCCMAAIFDGPTTAVTRAPRRFGKLHNCGPNAARRTRDQHMVRCTNVGAVNHILGCPHRRMESLPTPHRSIHNRSQKPPVSEQRRTVRMLHQKSEAIQILSSESNPSRRIQARTNTRLPICGLSIPSPCATTSPQQSVP